MHRLLHRTEIVPSMQMVKIHIDGWWLCMYNNRGCGRFHSLQPGRSIYPVLSCIRLRRRFPLCLISHLLCINLCNCVLFHTRLARQCYPLAFQMSTMGSNKACLLYWSKNTDLPRCTYLNYRTKNDSERQAKYLFILDFRKLLIN